MDPRLYAGKKEEELKKGKKAKKASKQDVEESLIREASTWFPEMRANDRKEKKSVSSKGPKK